MQPRDRPTCRAPHGKVTIEPSHMGSLRGGPMRQRAACNQRRCFKCGRNRQEFAHRLRVVLPIPKQCKVLVEAILIAGMKDQPETFGRYRRGYLEIDFSPRFGIAIQDFIASLFVNDGRERLAQSKGIVDSTHKTEPAGRVRDMRRVACEKDASDPIGGSRPLLHAEAVVQEYVRVLHQVLVELVGEPVASVLVAPPDSSSS